jgi:hypothetical protein
VQTLISHGHNLEQIRHYSKKQIVCFLEAIIKIEKDRIERDTNVNRIAQADNKDYKKFLKELKKGD